VSVVVNGSWFLLQIFVVCVLGWFVGSGFGVFAGCGATGF
jgi:hypothetical protein